MLFTSIGFILAEIFASELIFRLILAFFYIMIMGFAIIGLSLTKKTLEPTSDGEIMSSYQSEGGVTRIHIPKRTNVKSTPGSIPKEIFTGSNDKLICAICKLELREGQEVFKCEDCLCLFHIEHITTWLEKNDNCPVCGKLLLFQK